MKKLVLMAGVIGSLFANSSMSQGEIQKVLSNNKVLNKIAPYVNNGYDNGKYYIAKLPVRGNPTAYISKKTGETFIGVAFDKNGKIIKIPLNKNVIKKGIVFSFGNKKGKDIYIVTDPECPYCKRFEEMSKGKLKDYNVHIIIMPLSFHRHSKAMTYYILNGKTDKERLERFRNSIEGGKNYQKFKPSKKQLDEYNNDIKNSKQAARELGAQGTPSLYDENFNPIQDWMRFLSKQTKTK
jgi:thiol:disulfide interchange protein DsbC